MNSPRDPHRRFFHRLRNLLEEAQAGRLELAGVPLLFLVGLDGPDRENAEAWLREILSGRGRILAGANPAGRDPVKDNPAPVEARPNSTIAGVSPEEKSLLWGK